MDICHELLKDNILQFFPQKIIHARMVKYFRSQYFFEIFQSKIKTRSSSDETDDNNDITLIVDTEFRCTL